MLWALKRTLSRTQPPYLPYYTTERWCDKTVSPTHGPRCEAPEAGIIRLTREMLGSGPTHNITVHPQNERTLPTLKVLLAFRSFPNPFHLDDIEQKSRSFCTILPLRGEPRIQSLVIASFIL